MPFVLLFYLVKISLFLLAGLLAELLATFLRSEGGKLCFCLSFFRPSLFFCFLSLAASFVPDLLAMCLGILLSYPTTSLTFYVSCVQCLFLSFFSFGLQFYLLSFSFVCHVDFLAVLLVIFLPFHWISFLFLHFLSVSSSFCSCPLLLHF